MKTVKIQIVALDEAECVLINAALDHYVESIELEKESEKIQTAFNETVADIRRKTQT